MEDKAGEDGVDFDEKWVSIKEFFGVKDSFPREQLFTRSYLGKVREKERRRERAREGGGDRDTD
jgi:hypothetical protein